MLPQATSYQASEVSPRLPKHHDVGVNFYQSFDALAANVRRVRIYKTISAWRVTQGAMAASVDSIDHPKAHTLSWRPDRAEQIAWAQVFLSILTQVRYTLPYRASNFA